MFKFISWAAIILVISSVSFLGYQLYVVNEKIDVISGRVHALPYKVNDRIHKLIGKLEHGHDS